MKKWMLIKNSLLGELRYELIKGLLERKALVAESKTSVAEAVRQLTSLDVMPTLISDCGATERSLLFERILCSVSGAMKTAKSNFAAHRRLLTKIQDTHSLMVTQNKREIDKLIEILEAATNKFDKLMEHNTRFVLQNSDFLTESEQLEKAVADFAQNRKKEFQALRQELLFEELSAAVKADNSSAIQNLIDDANFSLDLNGRDLEGHCILEVAVKAGSGSVAVLFAGGLDPLMCTKDNKPIVWLALDTNFQHLPGLINGGCDIDQLEEKTGTTALHRATREGNERAVSLCLQNGANPSKVGSGGITALHLACKLSLAPGSGSNSSELSLCEKIVGLLISFGAGPNVRDQDGNCPIHLLANFVRAGAVRKLLVEHGARRKRNKKGKRPFEEGMFKEETALWKTRKVIAADFDPVGKASPQWREKSSTCMACSTKFNPLTNRKQHCLRSNTSPYYVAFLSPSSFVFLLPQPPTCHNCRFPIRSISEQSKNMFFLRLVLTLFAACPFWGFFLLLIWFLAILAPPLALQVRHFGLL